MLIYLLTGRSQDMLCTHVPWTLFIAKITDHVTFQVLTAETMESTIFWNVTPCNLTEVHDVLTKFCWILPDYMMSLPRRLYHSVQTVHLSPLQMKENVHWTFPYHEVTDSAHQHACAQMLKQPDTRTVNAGTKMLQLLNRCTKELTFSAWKIQRGKLQHWFLLK